MDETKEVKAYIGNGVTVKRPVLNKTKIVDMAKLRKLYQENKDKEFYTGMATDWFWTAHQIKSEGDIDNLFLRSTCWDTPIVEIDDEKIDCYIKVDKEIYSAIREEGYNRGIYRFEFWLPDFFQRFNALKYEELKRFWDEVKTTLERYEANPEALKNKK